MDMLFLFAAGSLDEFQAGLDVIFTGVVQCWYSLAFRVVQRFGAYVAISRDDAIAVVYG